MTNAIVAVLAIAVPALSVFGVVYRRFVKTASNELEPFSRYLTRGIKYYVGRYVRRQLAAELTLRQYARTCLQSSAVEMVVPARYPVQLRVDDVFVPLLLRGASGDTTGYSELLGHSRARVAVIGEPGSGKSSLMKRLFRDACRKANADPRRSPLPILFELRELGRLPTAELQQLDDERLLALCTRSFTHASLFHTNDALEYLSHGAGYLLLLDGLDEVPSDAAVQAIRAICDLSTTLDQTSPRSSIIVSTRTQHYLSLRDRAFKEIFHPLSVRPFSAADVYRFLLKWPFGADRKLQITRLYSRVRNLPSLAEMCTNPLALSMFVARDQQTDGAATPETRSAFYAALVEELLVHRRARSNQTTAGHQRLLRQRESILGQACLEHLLDPDDSPNSLTSSRLVAAVEQAGWPAGEARSVLAELAIDTGLLSEEREGETFRFLHLTLCEFLAAREVVNRGPEGWRAIQRRFAAGEDDQRLAHEDWSSRLAEVTAFASGLAPRVTCEAILQDLASSDEPVVLLKAAIEAQSYDHQPVLDAIAKIGDDLAAEAPSRWDVTWFAELRWLIAVLRDIAAGTNDRLGHYSGGSMPSPASYLIQLIERHGAEDVLLATLARQDADAAIAIAEASRRLPLMDVVAGAADDFSVLVGVLAHCEAGHELWAQVLVHVALRNPEIAQVLVANTDQLGTSAPSEHRRWADAAPLRGSTYGRLIDHVLQRPCEWREEDRPYLERLARVRPPRSDLAFAVRPGLIASVLLAAGVLAAAIVHDLVIDSGPSPDLKTAWQGIFVAIPLLIALSLGFRALAGPSPFAYLRFHWAERGRDRGEADPEEFLARLDDLADRPYRLDAEPLSRAIVLSEIFNLNRSAFFGLQMGFDGTPTAVPGKGARALAGVRLADLELVWLLYQERLRSELFAEALPRPTAVVGD